MSRIVLPVDTLGSSVPVPLWQFARMVSLAYTGEGSATLSWEADQDDVVLLRAVDCRAQIRVGSAGGWAVLLAGQAIAQPVRNGQLAVIEALEPGRLEIIPFDRSGDDFR